MFWLTTRETRVMWHDTVMRDLYLLVHAFEDTIPVHPSYIVAEYCTDFSRVYFIIEVLVTIERLISLLLTILLLNAGADLSVQGKWKITDPLTTPLGIAKERGKTEAVHVLREAGELDLGFTAQLSSSYLLMTTLATTHSSCHILAKVLEWKYCSCPTICFSHWTIFSLPWCIPIAIEVLPFKDVCIQGQCLVMMCNCFCMHQVHWNDILCTLSLLIQGTLQMCGRMQVAMESKMII